MYEKELSTCVASCHSAYTELLGIHLGFIDLSLLVPTSDAPQIRLQQTGVAENGTGPITDLRL
jgi:hypothetical protein